VGYSHYYQVFQSVDHGQNPANYSYNGSTYHVYTGQTNPAYYGLPTLGFQGYSFQLGLGWPKTVGPDGVWQISDSVSYLRGNHTFKFGGEVLVSQSTNNVTANTKGPVRFGPSGAVGQALQTLQNFFSGNMNRALFTAGDLLRHLESQSYGAFAQDDWRLSRTVTVNLGVRYELNTVFTERNNLMGNFDPNRGLVQVGKQIGGAFNGDHNNFAPRVGLAWDVGGNGKTVIRVGGGIFYEQGSYDSFMAIGNLLGLRTVPNGVNLYTNGNPKSNYSRRHHQCGGHYFYGYSTGIPNHVGHNQIQLGEQRFRHASLQRLPCLRRRDGVASQRLAATALRRFGSGPESPHALCHQLEHRYPAGNYEQSLARCGLPRQPCHEVSRDSGLESTTVGERLQSRVGEPGDSRESRQPLSRERCDGL
jgi:hypothetical protein